jgi:uncharacterized protein (DUF1697 family)
MGAFVALFRAINVGGNNAVRMDALREMHESLGFRKVTTLLQTGNVVFECDETDPAKLAGLIAREFEKKFGFKSEVMVRTPAQLKELLNKNPFQNQPEKENKWIAVMFLSGHPDAEAKKALLDSYSGPEEILIDGQEMYIYYPIGTGRSKLTNVLIEKKLKVHGTGRNWNTVTKLLQMTKD